MQSAARGGGATNHGRLDAEERLDREVGRAAHGGLAVVPSSSSLSSSLVGCLRGGSPGRRAGGRIGARGERGKERRAPGTAARPSAPAATAHPLLLLLLHLSLFRLSRS
jgi:hypothetical protein